MIPRQRESGESVTGSILAVVGTDVHGFDRLIEWLERWYANRRAALSQSASGPISASGGPVGVPELIIQYGHSRTPSVPGATAFLGHEELQHAMARATLVISHGGPATITEARRNGHLPIVVPRDPTQREHVDNHQQLFSRRLGAAGMVRLCETEAELVDALDRGLADPSLFALSADAQGQGARAEAVAKVGQIVEELVAQRSRRTVRWRR